MKKGLIFLLGIMSFFGVNTVNAEEIYLEYDTNVNQIKSHVDDIGIDLINNQIYELIDYYNENLASSLPYYFITFYVNTFDNFNVQLTAFEKINYSFNYVFSDYTSVIEYKFPIDGLTNQIRFTHDKTSNSFGDMYVSGGSYSNPELFSISLENSYYNPYYYYFSNFDLFYKGSSITDDINLSLLKQNDNLNIPYLDGSNKYHVYNAFSDFIIEPYYLYDGNIELKEETYTEINLNNYSYIALSLKDYNTIPENNYSTYTNMYVKGQLCITPVYNYGLTERKDILSGTQMQGCSKYYDDFTLTRMYILRTDVQNHAIYYLKAYDTSKDNYVKVDTSKFNITYITSENENNPEVLINGKLYPTLPYSSLTDTSTKSEDEGYTSGVSCAVGDFNCYNENNTSNIFVDLFDKPLEMLKSVWSAIISIFDLIGQFIALLPPTMQGFLYISFGIAMILGIIKIIL